MVNSISSSLCVTFILHSPYDTSSRSATASKTVPYLAAQWYQTDFDPEDGEFSDYSYVNFGFGIRNFFNEFAALNTSVNYGFSLAEDSEGGVLLILTGVSVIF